MKETNENAVCESQIKFRGMAWERNGIQLKRRERL